MIRPIETGLYIYYNHALSVFCANLSLLVMFSMNCIKKYKIYYVCFDLK